MPRTAKIVLVLVMFSMALAFAAPVMADEAGDLSIEPTLSAGMVRVQDDDLRVSIGGTWSYSWGGYSGGSAHTSSRAGSWASASFDGTGCALLSRRGPDKGQATVYIDGLPVETIDLYSSVASGTESVWATDTLTAGVHTVKIVASGTKAAASTGKTVIVDAFDLGGVPTAAVMPAKLVNNGHGNLLKLGRWATSTRLDSLGGSSWRTVSAGRSVTMRFKGSSVTWLGLKGPRSGKAYVYLDGKRVATVGQYAAEPQESRVAWRVSGLPWGVHSITIKTIGVAAAESTGTAVEVDAFAYNGTLLKASRPTPFKYPWRTYIVIDKSSFKLYWVKNGYLVKTYPIAVGRVGMTTPSRTWRIDAKYHTDSRSVYGPRKMRLFKQVKTSSGSRYVRTAYLIHGTNQPWVIGTRASHGCIRMYNRDVLELFPQVPLGTMVVTRD